MLEIDDLRKRFGDTVALDGVSFTVEAGQMVGFVGGPRPGGPPPPRALAPQRGHHAVLIDADRHFVLLCPVLVGHVDYAFPQRRSPGSMMFWLVRGLSMLAGALAFFFLAEWLIAAGYLSGPINLVYLAAGSVAFMALLNSARRNGSLLQTGE
jgi:hypothetical protein